MTQLWYRSLALGSVLLMGCLGAAAARAKDISVCAHGCAYRQLARAVGAAHNGDSVTVGRGSYVGGFTIRKSLTLNGAGARRTTVRGGGPVITVGVDNAKTEPVVTLRGITIMGGLTRASGGSRYQALGGGVWIPPSKQGGVGATVTILHSVIAHNTVAPSISVDAGKSHPCSDTSDCQFAQAGGGGIDSWGDLTIKDSVIKDNAAAGPVTSDADGGGIYGQQGELTIDGSVITHNRSIARPKVGRFAEGAGIMFDTTFSGGCVKPAPACHVVIRHSTVSKNDSALTTRLPSFAKGKLIGTGANAGGIHIGDHIATTVLDTNIVGNSTSAYNPEGEATAIDAAMIVGDSLLTLRHSRISGNRTSNTVATSTDFGFGGPVLELDGPATISQMTLERNVSSETSQSGLASASGAFGVFNFSHDPKLVTVRDSRIIDNVAKARSVTGQASVQGVGVVNNSLLLMVGVTVKGNVGRAEGKGGLAQGGGIWNGVDLSGPPVELTLRHSRIVENQLVASPGITPQGGGLYATSPVTREDTVIAGNQPDQCDGCSLTSGK